MKVICAGMSKTGTKTMQCALKDLGYNVYDYMENFTYLRDDWRKIMTKGGTTEDFRRMFENVDAVTDLPACYYWDEIHKAFPDAKIILMMRESEEVWMKSLRNQVKAGQNIVFRLMPFISLAGRQFDNFTALIGESVWGLEYQRNLFSEPQLNELQMRMTYRRHNSHVLQAAPKDKLLVFNVKEGWKPLCDFLGVPVPDKPFPRKNVRGNIVEDLMQNDPFFIRIQREMLFVDLP
uniref:Sulfotransferase n=1 Tax=Ciona savignyi TaxID=51511 RepID=H2ZPT8_CIOSA